jgi:hypothetical protein
MFPQVDYFGSHFRGAESRLGHRPYGTGERNHTAVVIDVACPMKN